MISSNLFKFLVKTKRLQEYSTEELANFPIEFFQHYIDAITLLNI